MDEAMWVMERLRQALQQRHGSRLEGYALPPPSFLAMQGEILTFDEHAGTLSARYPILPAQLNPYGALQGGFLAAAIDNTFGPLSMLVAPPNVTRRLEITYNRPAMPEQSHLVVHARLEGRADRKLELSATVLDGQGHRLARARAMHYLVEPDR